MQIGFDGRETPIADIITERKTNQGNRLPRPTELWGATAGRTCGECKHLLAVRYRGKVYRKCEVWRLSHSTATDKRLKDQACGKFEGVKR
jgi:hypothetical protein